MNYSAIIIGMIFITTHNFSIAYVAYILTAPKRNDDKNYYKIEKEKAKARIISLFISFTIILNTIFVYGYLY